MTTNESKPKPSNQSPSTSMLDNISKWELGAIPTAALVELLHEVGILQETLGLSDRQTVSVLLLCFGLLVVVRMILDARKGAGKSK